MHLTTLIKSHRWPGAWLCVLLPLIGLLIVQPSLSSELTVDALRCGRWWTLWSGHLLHYTLEHFIWDTLMFVIFAGALWRQEGWRLWLWLLVAAPLISIAVFWVEHDLYEYRGLSALDTMLCVRFFADFVRSASLPVRWGLGGLPLFGLFLKIGYELITGQSLFVGDLGVGVIPLPSAHCLGGLCGLVWAAYRT